MAAPARSSPTSPRNLQADDGTALSPEEKYIQHQREWLAPGSARSAAAAEPTSSPVQDPNSSKEPVPRNCRMQEIPPLPLLHLGENRKDSDATGTPMTEAPPEILRTVSDLQKQVSQLQDVVRALSATAPTALSPNTSPLHSPWKLAHPWAGADATESLGAFTARARDTEATERMMARSPSEEALLRTYRQRRMQSDAAGADDAAETGASTSPLEEPSAAPTATATPAGASVATSNAPSRCSQDTIDREDRDALVGTTYGNPTEAAVAAAGGTRSAAHGSRSPTPPGGTRQGGAVTTVIAPKRAAQPWSRAASRHDDRSPRQISAEEGGQPRPTSATGANPVVPAPAPAAPQTAWKVLRQRLLSSAVEQHQPASAVERPGMTARELAHQVCSQLVAQHGALEAAAVSAALELRLCTELEVDNYIEVALGATDDMQVSTLISNGPFAALLEALPSVKLAWPQFEEALREVFSVQLSRRGARQVFQLLDAEHSGLVELLYLAKFEGPAPDVESSVRQRPNSLSPTPKFMSGPNAEKIPRGSGDAEDRRPQSSRLQRRPSRAPGDMSDRKGSETRLSTAKAASAASTGVRLEAEQHSAFSTMLRIKDDEIRWHRQARVTGTSPRRLGSSPERPAPAHALAPVAGAVTLVKPNRHSSPRARQLSPRPVATGPIQVRDMSHSRSPSPRMAIPAHSQGKFATSLHPKCIKVATSPRRSERPTVNSSMRMSSGRRSTPRSTSSATTLVNSIASQNSLHDEAKRRANSLHSLLAFAAEVQARNGPEPSSTGNSSVHEDEPQREPPVTPPLPAHENWLVTRQQEATPPQTPPIAVTPSWPAQGKAEISDPATDKETVSDPLTDKEASDPAEEPRPEQQSSKQSSKERSRESSRSDELPAAASPPVGNSVSSVMAPPSARLVVPTRTVVTGAPSAAGVLNSTAMAGAAPTPPLAVQVLAPSAGPSRASSTGRIVKPAQPLESGDCPQSSRAPNGWTADSRQSMPLQVQTGTSMIAPSTTPQRRWMPLTSGELRTPQQARPKEYSFGASLHVQMGKATPGCELARPPAMPTGSGRTHSTPAAPALARALSPRALPTVSAAAASGVPGTSVGVTPAANAHILVTR
mmetsp:Transcript_84768/g.162170  ORF Transcript_84768/g.162170 Transcript_84768/m.162170 type:complete len:1113 (-) Transcript_84768:135-3473(-)